MLAPTEALADLAALSSAQGRHDPYPHYARLHSRGPAIRLAQGVVVHGYDEINAILRDPKFLVTNPAAIPQRLPDITGHPTYECSSNWLLTLNDHRHARLRNLLRPWFSRRRIDELTPATEAKVEKLIESIARRAADGTASIDLVAEFAEPLPLAVICDTIGIPPADRGDMGSIARTLVIATEFPSGSTLARCDAAFAKMTSYFDDLIDRRRKAPLDDLVSYLVPACDDDGLSPRDLANNLMVLLAAGTQTTTNLIANGLNLIIGSPSVATALRSGDVPISEFVREVLRYEAPVQLTRRLGRRCDIAGVSAHPGDDITLLLGAGNRDPRRFENPDCFEPRRGGPEPLSFSGGAHYCIGVALARMEASIAFARLLRRFPAITAAEPPRRRNSFIHRGFSRLPAAMGVR